MARGFDGADIQAGRLPSAEYEANFADLHPPLSGHEALVAADRCYFCYDAPCVTACPTSIDIPMFIRQIATGNTAGSAKTIFDQNILGGMCARVCPTETLCEQACVREMAEGKPVEIGRLQRFATDHQMAAGTQPYTRATPTGKRAAVVGAGPAGLACAHRLALHGHDVVLYDAKPKPGGLNEYGIAAYKTVGDFAQAEADYILSIGGITLELGKALGREITLDGLRRDFDAVFLGMGLGGVNGLKIEGEELAVSDAVDFIAELRDTKDLSSLAIGRRVVVIGGGMTAVDAAVQSKLLGAEDVTIVYRRGQQDMNASLYEQDLAQTKGVKIKHWARPVRVIDDGARRGVEFEYTRQGAGGLEGTGETFGVEADMAFAAIGQTLEPGGLDIALDGGRIQVDDDYRTSLDGVWAGGDCVSRGDDLTVTAVAQGRDAAEAMHRALTA